MTGLSSTPWYRLQVFFSTSLWDSMHGAAVMDTAHVSCSGKMACSFRLSFYKVWISVQRFEGNHIVANASKYSLMSLICSSTESISNAEVDASIFFVRN